MIYIAYSNHDSIIWPGGACFCPEKQRILNELTRNTLVTKQSVFRGELKVIPKKYLIGFALSYGLGLVLGHVLYERLKDK